jgi:hypothetical protein
MFSFTSKLEKFDSNLWHHHIPVPDEVAMALIEGDNKRVVCTLNLEMSWPAALLKSEYYWFILVNKNAISKLELQQGKVVEVKLEKDRSTYGHEMSEEMTVVLDQDDEAKHWFDALSPGKQRSLIYLAGKVKNTDSRLRKAMAIADHLKEVKGKLDFKKLNEKIKFYNQQGKLW